MQLHYVGNLTLLLYRDIHYQATSDKRSYDYDKKIHGKPYN